MILAATVSASITPNKPPPDLNVPSAPVKLLPDLAALSIVIGAPPPPVGSLPLAFKSQPQLR